MRYVHITRQRDGHWYPVRSWAIWGGAEALEWNDARWAELGDGRYRITFGSDGTYTEPRDFTVRAGKAYLDSGEQWRLS